MRKTHDERADEEPRRSWWARLSARSRERLFLGALVGAGVAARDLVLVGSGLVTFAALELADAFTPAAPAASG